MPLISLHWIPSTLQLAKPTISYHFEREVIYGWYVTTRVRHECHKKHSAITMKVIIYSLHSVKPCFFFSTLVLLFHFCFIHLFIYVSAHCSCGLFQDNLMVSSDQWVVCSHFLICYLKDCQGKLGYKFTMIRHTQLLDNTTKYPLTDPLILIPLSEYCWIPAVFVPSPL